MLQVVALKMIKLLVAELLQLTEYGRCNKINKIVAERKVPATRSTASATIEIA